MNAIDKSVSCSDLSVVAVPKNASTEAMTNDESGFIPSSAAVRDTL